MDNLGKYFLISALFFFIVDYTTAFSPDFQRWTLYMPEIFLFYFGYPLVFAFLIYKLKWGEKEVFCATAVTSLFLEIIVFNNALLSTFPIMMAMIPMAVSIYSLITLVPKWIVERSLGGNRWKAALLVAVWAAVTVLRIFGGG